MTALRIIATVLVYNEADIVAQVLDNLHRNRIEFVVLDGGSQDGSIEIARGFRGKGLLEHRTLNRGVWKLQADLDCLVEMAARHTPDWIVLNDADEFLEPRELRTTLHEAIVRENREGHNVVQFDNFEFSLTERDSESKEPDVRKRLRFYKWSDDYRYKAWKYYPGATFSSTGGHRPVFPKGVKAKLSPRKFVMRHYRFRSIEQAMRKVFKERLPRYATEERAKGWHVQYDDFRSDPKFFVENSKTLSEYNEDGMWEIVRDPDWYPMYLTSDELFGSPTARMAALISRIMNPKKSVVLLKRVAGRRFSRSQSG